MATADPTSSNGKAATAAADATKPQVPLIDRARRDSGHADRRAIKTRNGFRGGRQVDSYDSQYGGPYQAVDAVNPTAWPYNENARDADVACGSSVFDCKTVYGDVTTNGGNAGSSPSQRISGVIDNNVAFVLPTATPGVAPIPSVDSATPVDTTVNLYAFTAGGTASTGLTVNKGATNNFYFRGDILGAATAFSNNNADGPVAKWQ